MKIAIVGTAGRKDDASQETPQLWLGMKACVAEILDQYPVESLCLISGGAAVADHLAVHWFLQQKAAQLRLHMPTEFLAQIPQYKDTGTRDFKQNPGRVANYYHHQFSLHCGLDSLREIAEAQRRGAECLITPGFKERNTRVAEEAEGLIAFTFGKEHRVKEGGTADTVRKFLAKRHGISYHIDLHTLRVFSPIGV